MKMWRCSVCGYIHEGNDLPENCPKCGAPREKFAEIEAQTAALIDRSRRTNQLHMELSFYLEQIRAVASQGVEDKLDPNCVMLFEKAAMQAVSLQQMVKAELAAHMGKGKWG